MQPASNASRLRIAALGFEQAFGASFGGTEAEIHVYTGLSLRDVRDILERHYLNRDPALSASAVTKLEKWSKGEQNHPTGRVASERRTRKAE
jgi:hypothetical protein